MTTTITTTNITEQFLSVFRHHPAGVALITAEVDGKPAALTATSVSSVSAEPPMVMFSVSSRSSSLPTVRAAETVVVHLLDEQDLELAQLGATSGIDRFAQTDRWDKLPTGEVRFHTAASWLKARVVNTMDANGSLVVLAEVEEAGGRNTDPACAGLHRPLTYHARSWHALREESKIQ